MLLLGWLAVIMVVTVAGAAQPRRRNVLMLAVDDLRGEFGDAFGSPEVLTPHIDTLAKTSVTFTRTFCQAATCGISRSSLLTSRRPDTTRVLTNGGCPFRTAPEHADWISLPRHFKNQGFETMVHPYPCTLPLTLYSCTLTLAGAIPTQGMGKIFHPGVCDGVAAGEDAKAWSVPYYHAPAPYATDAKFQKRCNCSASTCPVGGTDCSCSNGSFLDGDCDGGPVHKRSKSFFSNSSSNGADMPDGMVESYGIQAIQGYADKYDQLAAANRSAPPNFFLAIGLHKPHLPHIAPQRFFDLYTEANISLPDVRTIPEGFPTKMWFACNEALSYPDWHMDACGKAGGGYGNSSCPNFSIDKPMSPALTRKHRLAYFASLSYTDFLIGNIVGALDSTSLADNTVVSTY